MPSYVEVQDLPTAVLDDEEAVEQLEGRCRHSKEIERNDGLMVILGNVSHCLAESRRGVMRRR